MNEKPKTIAVNKKTTMNSFKLEADSDMLTKRGIKKSLIHKFVTYCRKKSPWIMHMSSGGCNGCSIEIAACIGPKFDVERFGMVSKELPRHADIILIEGPMTTKLKNRVLDIYNKTPEPKVVVAIGTCPMSNGIYFDCYNVNGPLDRFIPVDVYVPGCPPKPEAIIHGIVQALEKLDEKA